MSLFDVTPDLQKLAENAKPGWYLGDVYKIKAGLSNKGNKKVTITFKIADGDAKGQFAFKNITDLEKMREHPQFIQRELKFIATLTNVVFDKQKGNKLFNSAEDAEKVLKGKRFEIKVEPNDYEGNITNSVTDIRPVGAGQKKA